MTCDYLEILISLKRDYFDKSLLEEYIDFFISECDALVKSNSSSICFIEYEFYIFNIIKLIKSKNCADEYTEPLNWMLHVLSIRRQENADWHKTKRECSFNLFDSALSCCCKGRCPDINERHVYYLSDISIDGYVAKRAYFYSLDNIGKDDKDRYYMAINRVKNIYSCQSNLVKLDDIIFEKDREQVKKKYRIGVRNRKAYWGYLADSERKPESNYCQACHFIECQEKTTNKPDDYKQLIKNNHDKASAIDLFRFCYARKQSL